MDPYAGWAEVYDVWTATTDDVGFYVEEAVAAGGQVVELGVGNGRVAIPVAQAGVEVIGIDASPSMLAIGRKRAAEAGVAHLTSWVEEDMRTFTLERPVRLVMIPARSFLHMMTTEDQLATLTRVREALVPGGRLIVNIFLPRPDVMTVLEGRRTHKGSWTDDHGRRCELDEILTHDWTAQLVRIRGIVRVFEEERHVETRELETDLRWIGRYEMEQLLARSGFATEALYGWFDRRPLDPTSTEMIWVARKP
jgi:ubiquinone/menaquinone biosynthesis C-methylase UbiE